MKRLVTIYDIAKEAGLSHTTVSRVLRNSSCVKTETRRRVQEIAQKLGYRHNSLAASLRTGVSRQIALIMPTGPFMHTGDMLLNGLQSQLKQEKYNVTLYPQLTSDNAQTVFSQVLDNGYDGLVTYLFTFKQIQPYVKFYQSLHCPVVIIGTPADIERQPGLISFDAGQCDGLQEVLKTLHKFGHQRVVHILGKHQVSSPQNQMIRAFVQKYGPADWQPELFSDEQGQTGLEEGFQMASRLITERPGVTAVQCPNDYFACGLIRGLGDLGIEVPRDISVIGSNNQRLCEYMFPRLSSIELGEFSAIPQIVSSLLEHIRQDDWSSLENHFELKSTFYQRGSVGPAPICE
ncbi:MAG: LacI family DNA-binding transcriptional regulator [Victivallales bacterium]|nr:LacI family DNA-binding transcriptional regulator [Victivallales bacterium]